MEQLVSFYGNIAVNTNTVFPDKKADSSWDPNYLEIKLNEELNK